MLFKTDKVMSPYCYRCPFNKAKPERADARENRKCKWECVGQVEKTFRAQNKRGNPYAAFVFEPLMQGAAGMIPQPDGWLGQVADIARDHGSLLIADEVMTGFGRTGCVAADVSNLTSIFGRKLEPPDVGCYESLFASHHEGVQPDFLCVAKGLTGGYLPMAATLTTQRFILTVEFHSPFSAYRLNRQPTSKLLRDHPRGNLSWLGASSVKLHWRVDGIPPPLSRVK